MTVTSPDGDANPSTNPAEQLVDAVLAVAADDGNLEEEAKYLLLAALEGDETLAEALEGQYVPPPPKPAPGPEPRPEPVGAFLKSITVSGFRGIGPEKTLDLHPAAGLTVIAGRNGSGKSTFAEAVEVALTSTSYRWRERSSGWLRDWANLHAPRPREIRVAIAEEGVGTTIVGVDWPADSERFDDLRSWVKRPRQKREPGVSGLGWADAVELYRPILSYEELGSLLTAAPSKLYDALSAILGLERVTEAQQRLDTQLALADEPLKRAKATRAELKKLLAESADERAAQALALLRKREPDLDALRRIATGSAPAPTGTLARLRALAELDLPDLTEIAAAATALRDAAAALGDAGTRDVAAGRRIELLRQALDLHDVHGADQPCPVCGTGVLDAQWRAAVIAEIADEDAESRRFRAARQEAGARRSAALRLIEAVPALEPVPDVGLTTLAAARAARATWTSNPGDDAGLARHLVQHADELHDALAALRAEAATLLLERNDTWAPLATAIASWLGFEEQARATEPRTRRIRAACSWLKDHTEQLRNQQLAPLADEARTIWATLRQESNVDLKRITMPKPVGKIRRVDIEAEVDGSDAGALGVMSTGELHALALALFIPRATRPESPFRFVVLDDPIQAMDPSKIDGFVTVLMELAATRQVIVFTHDDRLSEAVRRLSGNARIIEVTRSAGSVVTVDDAFDPSERDITDAIALASDPKVAPEIVTAVVPRLCRSAVETAARDTWFARAFALGANRHEVEATWGAARSQAQRIALAVHGDAQKPISTWLGHGARRAALDVCGGGVHKGLDGGPRRAVPVVRDVERLVADVKASLR